MAKGSVLDRHIPGGRLNDKGQLEMPNIDESGTALMVVDQGLPPEAWSRLDELEAKIKAKQNEAASHIAEWLFEARGIWRYHRAEGGFRGWVESRLGYTDRTAYNLISVYENLGNQSTKIFQTLGRSALYELAKEDTPEEVVQEVAARAEDGEKVSHAEVKRLIAEAKEAGKKEIAALLNLEIAETEEKLRRARMRLEKQDERLANSIDKAKADAIIEDAVAPLEKKLRDAQEKLRRYEEEKRQGGKIVDVIQERTPLLPGFTRVKSALSDLMKTLTVSPEEFCEAAEQLERLNGKPASEVLSEPVEQARVIVAWLNKTITTFEEM